MDAKTFILIVCALHCANSAGLLRKPKVYNALITTDEHLTPSRAFPIIQPTIHETGIASFPFGLHAYRYINPGLSPRFGPPPAEGIYRSNHPQAYNGLPKEQIPLDPPQNQIQESGPSGPADYPLNLNQAPPRAPEGEIHQPFPLPHPQNNHQQPPIPPEAGRPPIPLNEFGLPPSLVPLQSFPRPQNPVNLQPYPFNNYPLIFDSFNRFQEPYLPPYGYYPPPNGFGIAPPNKNEQSGYGPHGGSMAMPGLENPSGAPTKKQEHIKESTQDMLKVQPVQPNVDGIKNLSANRNSEVPDVPPPPIPSGAKIAK